MINYRNGNVQEFSIKSKGFYKKVKIMAKIKKNTLRRNLQNALGKNPALALKDAPQGLMITLPDIQFDFNSAKLNRENRQVIDRVVEVLKSYPNLNLLIRGHTDNIGTREYNKELSLKRARGIAEYILANTEYKPEQISFIGLGESSPVASNYTAQGRKKNRRVEIIILNK